jgi:MEDS: MEthanogen/methylotroph, DcmR Sensory domain
MAPRATIDSDLGFQVGDHVCAFYSSSSNSLDDIVVDYLSAGLQAGHKCFGMVDTPSAVRDQIPGDLVSRDGMLSILTEDEAYIAVPLLSPPHESALSQKRQSRKILEMTPVGRQEWSVVIYRCDTDP